MKGARNTVDPMRVLVSGGAGFIGSHTVVQLVAAGHDVVVVDSFVNSKPSVVARIEALTGQPLPLHAFDLTDRDKTEHLFSTEDIDAVIHFAGLKAVGESTERPLDYYENNLGTTFSLLRAMERHGVSTMVFSSSATVYGAEAPVPMHEDLPTSATNPYGWSKVMQEQVFRDVAAAHPHWRIALRHIRPTVLPPLIVQATLAIAAAVIAEASLSFLGLGQQPPAPSWGSMLNTAKNYVDQAPWMAIWPGLSIFLLVLSFNLLGDGLRDALDPRHK